VSHPDLSHLRAGHRRLTPQRRLLWEILHSSHDHLTAEDIHNAASARLSELSLPTVYRILVDLVESNHVRELAVPHGPSRYEAICADDRHSDLVCNSCGHIEKLRDAALDALRQAATEQYGFQTDNLHTVLYGTCHRCRAALSQSA
jgi:Fe2+ or Zn2+ uptake regulation protein